MKRIEPVKAIGTTVGALLMVVSVATVIASIFAGKKSEVRKWTNDFDDPHFV